MKIRSLQLSISFNEPFAQYAVRSNFMKYIFPTSAAAVFALALLSLPGHCAAQQATPANNQQPADPQLKLSPTKILQAFEPAADEEYLIGSGDELNIDVTGYPELTGKRTVGPDGRITLPVAGSFKIADQTRETAAKTVTDALTPYYKNPSVTIGIDKYGSNHILVLGNVQHPGVLQYDGTPTLLDAIARAGMMANSTTKDGIPERCMIYRGDSQVVTVQLRQLLQTGNAMGDMRLRRNDMIFVPVQQQDLVSVIGDVQHPGPMPLTPELTLRLAISQAGGLTEAAGGNPMIHIVQTSTNKTMDIRFKELMKPSGGDEVTLHPGDMIFIPKSGFYKFTTVVSKLSPMATLATFAMVP